MKELSKEKILEAFNVEFHISTIIRRHSSICLIYSDGRRIGRLDFNSGVMVFEGDAEESAKVFFDALAEKFADRLKEEREKEREACANILTSKITRYEQLSKEADQLFFPDIADSIRGSMQNLTEWAAAIRARIEE
jgi:hypothetical protein